MLRNRLKDARKAAGMTQQSLARKVGVSQSTIASLETGEHKTATNLAEIAAVLGVEALWLSSGRGPKTADATIRVVDHGVPERVIELAKKLALVPDEKLKAVSVLLGIKL